MVQVRGKTVEHYQWKQGLVLLGVYTQYDFFATQAGAGNGSLPVLMREGVHMLGRLASQTNITYTNFAAGAPPANKFNIAKGPLDGCPKSKHCSGTAWQEHRLASRQLATHAMYARA